MQDRQERAVYSVLQSLKTDPAVKAVFLKGSIARGDDDAHSDVDLYCMVSEEDLDEFLTRRLMHLEAHRDLVFHSESNFVGPQIVAVFDDGLHFDLYTVTPRSLRHSDAIAILHDPDDLLAHYEPRDLSLDAEEIARRFDSFAFSLLEYEAAYLRGDILWATRLSHHLAGDLGIIMRFVSDPSRAQLGLKRCEKNLDPTIRRTLSLALDGLTPSSHPTGVKQLVKLAQCTLEEMEQDIIAQINTGFFQFMKSKIAGLPGPPTSPRDG